MKMKKLLALLLALAMVFSLAACGGSTQQGDDQTGTNDSESTDSESTDSESSEDEPVYGGSMTMYWREIENYYDPAMLITYGYGSVWCESLWTIDLSSGNEYAGSYVTYDQLVGQIADTWDFNYDTGEFTVTIRDDIYFHDKEPVNGRQLVAADVKYTYDRVLGTDSSVAKVDTENDWTNDLYMIESITTDGDYTVIFQFKEGSRTEVALNDFMIASVLITSHEWDECPQTWEYAYGTGPYILTGCDVGITLEFTKNENYYDYDERHPENKLPYLDSITLVEIEDTANRLSQFISGEIEWLSSTSQVLSTNEIATLTSTLNEDEYIVWDYELGRPYGLMLRNDTDPFTDVNVRIALQKAIPAEVIHKEYLGFTNEFEIPGLWTPSLSDYIWEWTDEVKAEFEYDPDAAKALLADAGYPDGFTFDCVVLAPVTDTDLYVLVAEYLSEIGVTMNLVTVSDIMEGLAMNTDPDEKRAMNTTYGGQENISAAVLIYSETGSNYGLRHNSEEFEQAIQDYWNAETQEDRVAAAQTMDELFVTNHWVICLGGMQVYQEFTSSAIQGYQGTRITTNNWLGHTISHVWKTAE